MGCYYYAAHEVSTGKVQRVQVVQRCACLTLWPLEAGCARGMVERIDLTSQIALKALTAQTAAYVNCADRYILIRSLGAGKLLISAAAGPHTDSDEAALASINPGCG